MNRVTATQGITISGDSCGTEIELTMQVEFSISKFIPATHREPAEEPTVELESVKFFYGSVVLKIPSWIEDRFTVTTGFTNWIMSEAEKQSRQEAEEHADYVREMRREYGDD